MAAPVKLTDTFLCNSPFLIKKMTFTAGNTTTVFAHGGPSTPSILFTQRSAADPTASENSVYAEDATNFNLDCEATTGTVTVYLVWLNAATGGLTPP